MRKPNFKTADPASFAFLWKRLERQPKPPEEAAEVFTMVTFQNVFVSPREPFLMPSSVARSELPGTFERIVQNMGLEGYSCYQPGYVLTTIFVSSAAAAVAAYFEAAASKGKSKAFVKFRVNVKTGVMARTVLVKHAWKIHESDELGHERLLKVVKKSAYREAFKAKMGNTILAVNYFCGPRSNRDDLREFKRLIKILNDCSSMEEFLRSFGGAAAA